MSQSLLLTITAYAAIARFPLNIAIQTVLCLLLASLYPVFMDA